MWVSLNFLCLVNRFALSLQIVKLWARKATSLTQRSAKNNKNVRKHCLNKYTSNIFNLKKDL